MTLRPLDFQGRFGDDVFTYDTETGLLYRASLKVGGDEPEWDNEVYAPHEEWRGRCYACDRSVPLLTNEGEGYAGFWVCDCGQAGHDEVHKCGSCGEKWGDSAAGEHDSTLCSYCDGTFLWEDCPACHGERGGELKLAENGHYRCTECKAEFDADDDGYPVVVGSIS